MKWVRLNEFVSHDEVINEIISLLMEGKLIVMPTETVYGLICDATNEEAILKLITAKKRKQDNPIAIFVSSSEKAKNLTQEWNEDAQTLFNHFSPGPITIILKKKPIISDILTQGKQTIGIRIPDEQTLLKLLEQYPNPLAATSANISGNPPAVTAEQAVEQLGMSVDYALDKGECKIGKASTVIDLSVSPYRIIREGSITKQQIEFLLNKEIS
jgi:L-threonylcarbamoyladenylate synthase